MVLRSISVDDKRKLFGKAGMKEVVYEQSPRKVQCSKTQCPLRNESSASDRILGRRRRRRPHQVRGRRIGAVQDVGNPPKAQP